MEISATVSESFYHYFILESTFTLLFALIFVCVFSSGKKPILVEIRSKFAQGLRLKLKYQNEGDIDSQLSKQNTREND